MRIVKADGLDFLAAQPDQSLDLVISTFAVHFMDREQLDRDRHHILFGWWGHACLFVSFLRVSYLKGPVEVI